MKNIYIFDETCVGSNYGVKTYISQILKSINMDAKIYYINFLSKKKFFEFKTENNITYIDIPCSVFSLNSICDYNKYFNNSFYLIKPFLSKNTNSYFLFNYINSTSLVNKIKTANCQAKIILTIHYSINIDYNSDNLPQNRYISYKSYYKPNDFSTKIKLKTESDFYRNMDKIICLSDYTYNNLIKIFNIDPSKIIKTKNSLNEIKPIDKFSKKNNRIKHNIPMNYTILIYVGRLDFMKGLFHAIEAFKLTIKKHPNSIFIIAGEGDFEKFLPLVISYKRNILIMGNVEKDILYELYSLSDIGIQPSFNEQCSFSTIEMMMFGLPVIVTDIKGGDELIVHEYTGLRTKYKKNESNFISQIAININYLIEDKNKVKQMQKNARKEFRDYYYNTYQNNKIFNL